jgi:uncharacterized protein (TIRG00374 family)
MLTGAMGRSNLWKVVGSSALAAGLLYFFFSRTSLADVADRILRIRPDDLALAVAASLLSLFLRTWRWQVILRPVRRVGFAPAFAATSIGFAASTVLPMRAGEIVRPIVLSRRSTVPFSAALASIVFERAIDLSTVLALFVVYATVPGVRPTLTGTAAHHFRVLSISAGAAGAAIAAFAAFGVWSVFRRDQLSRLLDRMLRPLPVRLRGKLSGGISSFLDGFSILGDRRAFVTTVAGSIVLWLVIDAQIFFLFRAFRLSLPFSATFVVLPVTLVGMAIPTPGAVGGFHKACQVALTYFYGVPLDTATGLAIVYHAVAFVPVTILGFILFVAGPRRPREGLVRLAGARPEE